MKRKDFILGLVSGDQSKAYLPEAIKKVGRIEDAFADMMIVGEYDKNLDVVRLFEKKENGDLERLNPFGSFWFAWVAAHPGTELYK